MPVILINICTHARYRGANRADCVANYNNSSRAATNNHPHYFINLHIVSLINWWTIRLMKCQKVACFDGSMMNEAGFTQQTPPLCPDTTSCWTPAGETRWGGGFTTLWLCSDHQATLFRCLTSPFSLWNDKAAVLLWRDPGVAARIHSPSHVAGPRDEHGAHRKNWITELIQLH